MQQTKDQLTPETIKSMLKSITLCHILLDSYRGAIFRNLHDYHKLPIRDDLDHCPELEKQLSEFLGPNLADQVFVPSKDVLNKLINKKYDIGYDVDKDLFNGVGLLMVSLFKPKSERAKGFTGEVGVRIGVLRSDVRNIVDKCVREMSNSMFDEELSINDYYSGDEIKKLKIRFLLQVLPFFEPEDYMESKLKLKLFCFSTFPFLTVASELIEKELIKNLPDYSYSEGSDDSPNLLEFLNIKPESFLIKNPQTQSYQFIPNFIFKDYFIVTTMITTPMIFTNPFIPIYNKSCPRLQEVFKTLVDKELKITSQLLLRSYGCLRHSFIIVDYMLKKLEKHESLNHTVKSGFEHLSLSDDFENVANFVSNRIFAYSGLPIGDEEKHDEKLSAIIFKLSSSDFHIISLDDGCDAVNHQDWVSGKYNNSDFDALLDEFDDVADYDDLRDYINEMIKDGSITEFEKSKINRLLVLLILKSLREKFGEPNIGMMVLYFDDLDKINKIAAGFVKPTGDIVPFDFK